MSTLTVVVLLFSYRTSLSSSMASGTAVHQSGTGQTAQAETAANAGSSSATPTSSGSSSTSATGTATYTGDSVDTRWGPVQVQITVTNGKITASQAVVYPNGNGRDAEINSQALPTLNQEVVNKQSASIDMVSGATVTSDGYVQSLQSAIDKANL
ncbi:FMN-binding protein [Calidifontibacter terrae]